MRGLSKVIKVPTTVSRQAGCLPIVVRGRTESIHSLTPTEKHKRVIEYLKNCSPSPNYQSGSSCLTNGFYLTEGPSRINTSNTGRLKLGSISKSKAVRETSADKEGNTLNKEIFSLEHLKDFKFFLMKSIKEDFEDRVPRIKMFKRLRKAKGFRNYTNL